VALRARVMGMEGWFSQLLFPIELFSPSRIAHVDAMARMARNRLVERPALSKLQWLHKGLRLPDKLG